MNNTRNTFGGGNQTNTNSLIFEEKTSLRAAILKNKDLSIKGENEVWSKGRRLGFIFEPIGKSKTNKPFYDYIQETYDIDAKKEFSKVIHPDKIFFNELQQRFYVIECKFQKDSGSVDEKLQTFPYKRAILNYMFFMKGIEVEVEYVYCLNETYFNKEVKNGPKKGEKSFYEVFKYIREMGSSYFFDAIPLNKIGIY